MTTSSELDVHVSAPGEIDGEVRRYAVDKITAVAAHTAEPVLTAEVRLRLEHNPSIDRPAIAEATLDLNGRPVRAHVAAGSPTEAIDLLEARLLRQVARHRAHREGKAHRNESGNGNGSWRHGDASARPTVLARPVDERDVVRLKTFALDPMTLDEAAFDLDLLGHDFYLFTEVTTGVDGVLTHTEDAYDWHPVDGSTGLPSPLAAPVTRHATGAPTLALEEALERLDTGGEPWVLFVDTETGRGAVAYRRFDGNYGVITSA